MSETAHPFSQAFGDEQLMHLALEEARAAERSGEVPVGCVVALGGTILARASNRTVADCDPTAHAEIVALRAAAKVIGNHRLTGATLCVTIEPCSMCAGAILQARIARLIYGADDPKGGAIRSSFHIFDSPSINHCVEISSGVLADESAALLQTFFAARR